MWDAGIVAKRLHAPTAHEFLESLHPKPTPSDTPVSLSKFGPRQAAPYFYYAMSPADNFGLFINIISLIDVFFRLLAWLLPHAQVEELGKSTTDDKDRGGEGGGNGARYRRGPRRAPEICSQ